MGSSISPPLAMLYMEYFEEYLYESGIPDDIKATEWKRYVDDCFVVYEHSDDKFQEFLSNLIFLAPSINFTCEMSKAGSDVGLSEEVLEALPFLDLMVMRYLDSSTGVISNKLSIYRKACHSGSYVHVLSNVPTSVKLSTVRNMFLRAYRYCDSLFLAAEESKIHDDFVKLGYDGRFIGRARRSARKGRDHELRVREGLDEPRARRERPRFKLWIPHHRKTYGLGYRFEQKGVDLCFSSRDTILSRVAGKNSRPTDTNGGVYMLACKNNTCEEVYVGHSKNIPRRLGEHADAARLGRRGYSSANHSARRGHRLDTGRKLIPYKSDSITHRLVVESCLINTCKTVEGNTSSAFSEDIGLIAPMILQVAPIDWEVISKAQPSFDQRLVPRKHRGHFSHNTGIAQELLEEVESLGPPSPDTPSPPRRATRSSVMLSDAPQRSSD